MLRKTMPSPPASPALFDSKKETTSINTTFGFLPFGSSAPLVSLSPLRRHFVEEPVKRPSSSPEVMLQAASIWPSAASVTIENARASRRQHSVPDLSVTASLWQGDTLLDGTIRRNIVEPSRRNSVPHVLTGESHVACWEDPLMTIFAPQQKNQQSMQPQAKPKRRELSAEGLENRFALLTIEDVYGHLYALCKDQHGCRFLQQKLTEDQPFVMDAIFEELYPHMIDIMMDPFGNYLMQKLIAKCSVAQRDALIRLIHPHVRLIALNPHGTRALQRLIEHSDACSELHLLIAELQRVALDLIQDVNGNHVMQKCLIRFDEAQRQFIFDAMVLHCQTIANHRYGCCVMQRCFDHGTVTQRWQLVRVITQHALDLVHDAFGNYVVQYVLNQQERQYADILIQRFIGHLEHLATLKFSSNVIEKVIRTASVSTKRQFIAELLNPDVMHTLLHDSYGNYVVQTAFDCADADQQFLLFESMRPILSKIRHLAHGKKIHARIVTYLQQRPQMTSTSSFALSSSAAPFTATHFGQEQNYSIAHSAPYMTSSTSRTNATSSCKPVPLHTFTRAVYPTYT